jgi:hypothetical protein
VWTVVYGALSSHFPRPKKSILAGHNANTLDRNSELAGAQSLFLLIRDNDSPGRDSMLRDNDEIVGYDRLDHLKLHRLAHLGGF